MAQNSKNQNASPLFEKPQVLFEWEAPARAFNKKSAAWFTSLILTAALIFLLFFIFDQWSLGFLVVALTFAFFAWYYFEPPPASYQILNTGVKINQSQTWFERLRSFWLEKSGDTTLLHFATYLAYPPFLTLVLDASINQEKLEEELLKYLPYHQEEYKNWVQILEVFLENLGGRLPVPLVNLYERILQQGSSLLATRFSRTPKLENSPKN